MINDSLSYKLVALFATAILLVASIQVGATPAFDRAALSVLGIVEVNGEKVISGGTFFSGCAIATAAQSEAAISIGRLGRVELSADTKMKLSFSETGLQGSLDKGSVRISTPAGVSVNLITPKGSVITDGQEPTTFTVTSKDGETTAAAMEGSLELISGADCAIIKSGSGGGHKTPQNRKRLFIWLAAIGGGVAAAIWIATHDSEPRAEDMSFGGTVIVPSG